MTDEAEKRTWDESRILQELHRHKSNMANLEDVRV